MYNDGVKDLFTSLSTLMDSIDVKSVEKDESFDPNDIFSVGAIARLSKLPNEEIIIENTADFLFKLKTVEFPGEVLQYSRISEQMFNKKYTYDAVENIAEIILLMVDTHFTYLFEGDKQLERRFYKLIDHMMLASFQLGEIAQHSIEKFEAISKELMNTKIELIHFKKELHDSNDDMKKEQSKIYIQFVTILGIFTAIVFSMFGGLKLLEFTLSSIQETATWKATAFFSMFSIATLSMLFLLLRWVSIIVDKASQKRDTTGFFKGLSTHFGFSTSISLFLYFIFISILFSNENVYTNFQSWISNISAHSMMGLIFLSPFLIFLAFLIVHLYNNRNKKSPIS